MRVCCTKPRIKGRPAVLRPHLRSFDAARSLRYKTLFGPGNNAELNATVFWSDKAVRFRSGRLVVGEAALGRREMHRDIVARARAEHPELKHVAFEFGFVGWDGLFYPSAELSLLIKQYLKQYLERHDGKYPSPAEHVTGLRNPNASNVANFRHKGA